MSKLKSIGGLIKKSYQKWAVEYHYRIPMPVLKMYVHKFFHESANIQKYDARYYDPENVEEYHKWLSLQEYEKTDTVFNDITVIGEDLDSSMYKPLKVQNMSILDLDCISTSYVCISHKEITVYPELFGYLKYCEGKDLLYFDHDHLVNGIRKDPVLKPDLAYDTLRGINYIGNLFLVRKELLKEFDGMPINAYAWLLRLTEKKIKVIHIEKILYADSYNKKDEVETAREYLGTKADMEVLKDGIGRKVYYRLNGTPKVSIMIPTRDGADVLKTCIDSIYEKTSYSNFEIIIGDNNSEKEETFDYFKEIQEEHSNIRIVRIESPFNFSYINNRMAETATGDYLLLLNNDTSVITSDWLEKMLSYASQKHVGSVGVRLWYPDGTIQHGGVIIGKGGAAAHRYYRCEQETKGYQYTLDIPNDVSCCTAACLMTGRECWKELNGMNETLTVQFNDVDYALRLLQHGYYNVFLPDVELYHYESKSRGIDKDPEAVKRFMSEVNYAKKEWAHQIQHDPFYNDNFDKNYDYKLIVGTGSN